MKLQTRENSKSTHQQQVNILLQFISLQLKIMTMLSKQPLKLLNTGEKFHKIERHLCLLCPDKDENTKRMLRE